jgi:hypothetical protein
MRSLNGLVGRHAVPEIIAVTIHAHRSSPVHRRSKVRITLPSITEDPPDEDSCVANALAGSRVR